MSKSIDRTPVDVKRGKGGTGGDHVPTKEGLRAELDFHLHRKRNLTTQRDDWSVKEKRARQHVRGIAIHPEFRGMTPLQIDRFCKDAEAEFWIAEMNLAHCNQDIERCTRLLEGKHLK